jgi:hypothetical protein
MRDISDGAVVTFFCQGDHRNPDFQFLDALTGSDPPSVKLSPRSDGVFTGTHWQCMEQTDGTFAFACAGAIPGLRYLDGRTVAGSVGLAGDTLPPFSGTLWRVQEISPGLVRLACQGSISRREHVYLDGNTFNGAVQLAPQDNPPSGTLWMTALVGRPTLRVVTTREIGAAQLELTGSGFSPNDNLFASAEGIVGRTNHAPFALGTVINTRGDGSFSGFAQVDYFSSQPVGQDVTVRVTDHHGMTASAPSNGFYP